MEQQRLSSADLAQGFGASLPAPGPLEERFELAFEQALSAFIGPIDGSPVAEHLRWHFGIGCEAGVARGKRLRPRLLFGIAFEEGGTFEEALDAALAIEFIHNYSLVHDDIEDSDRLRRGRQTVWARYGIAHGINAGDALSAVSYLTLLANRGGAPPERVIAATSVLQRANFAMCVGQGYDLEFESASQVSLSSYLSMIDGKTATLFGAACELGAVCAGAQEHRARAYGEFGRAYGRAFQIRDDVRGIVSDVARRKWSFPVVWALAGTDSDARRAIATRYARCVPLDGPDVTAIVAALDELGARAAAEAACEQQMLRARRLAQRFHLDRNRTVRALFV
jgi:geranylgeranyl diphosphate synthase type I